MPVAKHASVPSINVARESQRVFKALAAFSAGGNAAERSELRKAGVSQLRIDTLYPFDLAEHLPYIAEIINDRQHFKHLGTLLRNSDVRESFGVLPEAEANFGWRHNVRDMVLHTHRGLIKHQHFRSQPNLNAHYVAEQWLYLILFAHACSTVNKRPKIDSPLGRRVALRLGKAEELVAYFQEAGIGTSWLAA